MPSGAGRLCPKRKWSERWTVLQTWSCAGGARGESILAAETLPKVEKADVANGEATTVNGTAAAAAAPRLAALAELQAQETGGETGDEGGSRKPSQAEWLIEHARAVAELWRTPDGETFATLPIGDHWEHWPLRGAGVRRWLRREYYDAHGKPPGAQAIQDALATLDAIAHFEGPTYPVYVRVAEHNDAIYVDLCDDAWRAVEITADGWRVVANPP